MNIPNIRRAGLEISYDNGGIHRDRTEARYLRELNGFINGSTFSKDELSAIDDWLGQLLSEDFNTICCGEQTDREGLLLTAPARTDELLNAIFEKVG